MQTVSVEEICDEFDVFGEEVNDDESIKLQELCSSFNIDANGIVNQWMAFSASRQVDLSVDNLDVFEREWLSKKVVEQNGRTPKGKKAKITNNNLCRTPTDGLDILDAYSTPEMKTQLTAKRQRTPDDNNHTPKRFNGTRTNHAEVDISSCLSPAGSTPSAKYSSRSNAGDVVLSFGDSKVTWSGTGKSCHVKHWDQSAILTYKMKYMFQKMSEKVCVLNSHIDEHGAILQKTHNIEDFSHVAVPNQETVSVCGRVCCDSIGRLNSQSTLLEGSLSTSVGKCVSLDLSELKRYSLFPGQILACDGINTTGKSFFVQRLYEPPPLVFPDFKPLNDDENLTVVVGVGPYAPNDGLDFSPLTDLIKVIKQNKPDMCVLMGPFVDVKNPLVNGGEMEISYEELFNQQMQQINMATKNLGCKVVVVPSYRDASHVQNVYPQPPFTSHTISSDGIKISSDEFDKESNLMFVSDPSTLSVNGVVIGITSTDILMHLTKSEISLGSQQGQDRMSRLVQHILNQKSYYPLYPPSEEVNVDYTLWESFANLPITPHLLLLPSDLKAFIKDINGCCCINPGRITTGQVGGTFAQIVLNTKALFSNPSSPSQAITAQIVKI